MKTIAEFQQFVRELYQENNKELNTYLESVFPVTILQEQPIKAVIDPFFTVIKGGDLHFLQYLAQQNPKVLKGTNEDGKTALHIATECGHTHVVEWLNYMEGTKDKCEMNCLLSM